MTSAQKLVEPTLEELLEEPIVRLVMAVDGVRADEVRDMITELKVKLYEQKAAVLNAAESQLHLETVLAVR
jgi:hypothetical protein